MQKQKGATKRRSISAYTLWGAVGFGIGGAVGGIITVYTHTGYGFFGFPILGAAGGAALGLTLKGWREAGRLAKAGVIGFLIGHLFSFGFGMGLGEILVQRQQSVGNTLEMVIFVLMGVILGAVSGASLGLALKDRKGAGLLALAGAIGFGVTEPFVLGVLPRLLGQTVLLQIMPLCISGIVGGAALGAALGYLEKKKADTQSQVS